MGPARPLSSRVWLLLIPLLLWIAWWIQRGSGSGFAAGPSVAVGLTGDRAVELRGSSGSQPAPVLVEGPVPGSTEASRDAVDPDPEEGAPRCRLWGRCVDPEGLPISGARVRMTHEAWSSSEPSAEPWWSLRGTREYETISDSDGRFEVDGLDRGLSLGTLQIDAAGYALSQGRLVYPDALDDGFMDCVLFPDARLDLFVEDEFGQAIGDLTAIDLQFHSLSATWSKPVLAMPEFDRERGVYPLERLPAGVFDLQLQRGLGRSMRFGPFEVARGRVGRAGLQWSHPPPLALRISLSPFGYPTQVLSELGVPSTVLVLHSAAKDQFSTLRGQTPTIDLSADIPPGPLSVDFDDRHFEPQLGVPATPGKRLSIQARGRAAIELTPLDATTGER